jgi:hypothetical protein
MHDIRDKSGRVTQKKCLGPTCKFSNQIAFRYHWYINTWRWTKIWHILGHLLHKYELTILILLLKGCEYGDKTDCSAVTSRNSCYLNGDDCCETCVPYVTNIASKIAYPINRIYLINIHTAKPSHFIATVCKCWYFLAKFWFTFRCLCINGNGMQFNKINMVNSYLCNKWPRICSVFRNPHSVLSHSWLMTGFVTRVIRRMPYVEQDIPILPEHQSSFLLNLQTQSWVMNEKEPNGDYEKRNISLVIYYTNMS